jgi:hypothetical protein
MLTIFEHHAKYRRTCTRRTRFTLVLNPVLPSCNSLSHVVVIETLPSCTLVGFYIELNVADPDEHHCWKYEDNNLSLRSLLGAVYMSTAIKAAVGILVGFGNRVGLFNI